MIRKLRLNEEIMLYGKLLKISEEDIEAVAGFLEEEFDREALDFPYVVPAFDKDAAGWAARTIFIAAQLILYRDDNPEDIESLLGGYPLEVNASAMLSADLCLRFIPEMIQQLKRIDSEDALIPILEDLLHRWHYSGVPYPLNVERLDFTVVVADKCLHTLYTNRIVGYKKLALAKHATFVNSIRASMGIYGMQLWKEFIENTD